MTRGQAERLVPALEEMLERAGLDWGALDAIGTGIGPGNFTGIRISVSAARGLALGLGIPAVGVSSFDALALDGPRPMIAAVGASREGAFHQRFDPDGPGAPGLTQADGALSGCQVLARDMADDPAGPCPILGHDLPGADAPAHSLARGIARVAASRLTGAPLPRPAPLYIRPADAAPARDLPPVLLD